LFAWADRAAASPIDPTARGIAPSPQGRAFSQTYGAQPRRATFAHAAISAIA